MRYRPITNVIKTSIFIILKKLTISTIWSFDVYETRYAAVIFFIFLIGIKEITSAYSSSIS